MGFWPVARAAQAGEPVAITRCLASIEPAVVLTITRSSAKRTLVASASSRTAPAAPASRTSEASNRSRWMNQAWPAGSRMVGRSTGPVPPSSIQFRSKARTQRARHWPPATAAIASAGVLLSRLAFRVPGTRRLWWWQLRCSAASMPRHNQRDRRPPRPPPPSPTSLHLRAYLALPVRAATCSADSA